jgi:hypothetical protein
MASEQTVWQISGGPASRSYASVFLRPGVGLIGPGDPGPWTPERIAVKWRYVDVTLFRALPRVPANCHLVIEAKRLGAGVEGALEQAKGYVLATGVPLEIVVTDGVRYRMYSHALGYAPVAYANLIRLKRSALDLFDRLNRP